MTVKFDNAVIVRLSISLLPPLFSPGDKEEVMSDFVNPYCCGKHCNSDTTKLSTKYLDGARNPEIVAKRGLAYISSNVAGFVTPLYNKLRHSSMAPDVKVEFSKGNTRAKKCPQPDMTKPSMKKFVT